MAEPARAVRAKTARFYRMRANVVQVAVELFSRNGYTGTGVADIGDAAGLARGALYYYIGSKEELLAEIHDLVMDPLVAEAEAILALEADFEARIRLLSESLLWQIVHRHDHVWVFLHEYRHLEGEYRTRFRGKRRHFEECIMRVLRDGVAQGFVRATDLRLATLAFLNLHNYTYQWWSDRESIGVEGLAEFYCGIFLNGVSTGREGSGFESDLSRGREMLGEMRAAAADADPVSR